MASDTTAASAAGSELRRLWAVAAILLVVLLTVAWFLELGKTSRVVVDVGLPLPAQPASESALGSAELLADAVSLTPSFTIEEPTTLELTLHRGPAEGWVGADIALIEERSGEVRQLRLATEVRASVGADMEAQRTARVLIDQVTPGEYHARIAPSWEPLEDPLPGRGESGEEARPPATTLRIVEGKRSYFALGLAVLLVLAPALAMTGWRFFRRLR